MTILNDEPLICEQCEEEEAQLQLPDGQLVCKDCAESILGAEDEELDEL